jgi:hypothetical protein
VPGLKEQSTISPLTAADGPELSFSRQHCVHQTAKVGDGFYDSEDGYRYGVITEVVSRTGGCADANFPTRVTVQFKGEALKAATSETEIREIKTESSQTASGYGVGQKLRELNALLKDGVITQEDFDAKKRELLKSY